MDDINTNLKTYKKIKRGLISGLVTTSTIFFISIALFIIDIRISSQMTVPFPMLSFLALPGLIVAIVFGIMSCFENGNKKKILEILNLQVPLNEKTALIKLAGVSRCFGLVPIIIASGGILCLFMMWAMELLICVLIFTIILLVIWILYSISITKNYLKKIKDETKVSGNNNYGAGGSAPSA